MARARVLVSILGSMFGCASCALFPSLDDLTPHDASADVLGDADASSGDDASNPDASSPWKTLSLVQSIGSTGQTTVSFSAPTIAGNLLVALEDSASAPSGAGWVGTTSNNGDAIFVWPNNPGGLQSFTIGADNGDVILAEIAGAPKTMTTDFEAESAVKGPTISSATASGAAPKQNGEIAFAYLDSSNAATGNPASSGWIPLNPDGDNDFAWFAATSSSSPFSLTVDFSPPTAAALMVLTFTTP